MTHQAKKRASEYLVGERLAEHDGRDVGEIVALKDDPTRPSMAYMLIMEADGKYTVYQTLTDALTFPWLARSIPKSVMVAFLRGIFPDADVPDVPDEKPTIKVVKKVDPEPPQAPQQPVVSMDNQQAPPDDNEDMDQPVVRIPVASVPALSALPEIDFP